MEKKHCKWLQIDSLVCMTVVIFGIGSWIDINGLWAESPLLITHGRLPEGWKLVSYISIITQIANIGPLFVTLMRTKAPGRLSDTVVVYVILGIGCIACLLLAFFWDSTSHIAGVERSTWLLTLTGFLALVDCTTSVVFLPFMVKFQEIYLTVYFIGEGMSSLVPGVVGFIQGSGSYSCQNISVINSTTNLTNYIIQLEFHDPVFSVRDFFLFLSCMVFASGTAFSFLNYSNYCKCAYAFNHADNKILEHESLHRSDYKNQNSKHFIAVEELSLMEKSNIDATENFSDRSPKYYYYLIITAIINGVKNTVLPSIATFSSLPYGLHTYHLTVILSLIANPLSCFAAMFLTVSSCFVISTCTSIGILSAVYIIYNASASPTPVLVGTFAGEFLVILSWILASIFLTYSGVSVANIFRRGGRRALLWIGVMQQLGSFLGAIITYFFINVWELFESAPLC
ncbi:riboflavin transporter 2-like [Saccostrea echinata]|uniref:riboflavin transporter 2-like n=1 Tax=Saccostrea echinata TaxID=191078 RepID=UPI002A802385|nr:riboflavin transporter 2-like [Saccostrea echinata]